MMTPSREWRRLEQEALDLADRAAAETNQARRTALEQEALRIWQAARKLKRANAAA